MTRPSPEALLSAGEWLLDHAANELPEIITKMLTEGLSSGDALSDIGHGMNLRVTLTMEEQNND